MVTCNTTLEEQYIDEVPIAFGMTFHHIGLIVSAIFAVTATALSAYLVFMHATHYSKPYVQRHIIRLLFIVPIYSVVSFLSFLYYRHAVYYQVLMGCYEAFAIASFFTLLCHYIASNLHDQKEYFRGIQPKPWVLPLNWFQKCTGGEHGLLRVPRSGLTWFNIVFLGVFQYCFVRVLMTVVAVISQATGRYCEASLNPAFAHIWVLVFEAVAVTIAMYCLIQFYVQLKEDLAPHRPLLKVICIKLVIFFSFWQTLVVSFLTSTHVLKPNDKINYSDYKVGIPAMMLCVEMAIFAVMHLFAFPWKEYRLSAASAFDGEGATYQGGKLGWRAIMDAYNPWDIIKAVSRSFRWLFVGRRRRMDDISYKTPLGDVGLEPTRTRTDYQGSAGRSDYELGAGAKTSTPGVYSVLRDEEGEEGYSRPRPEDLFGRAQYPASTSMPGAYAGGQFDSVDVGDRRQHGRPEASGGPDRLTTSHPGPGTINHGRQQPPESYVVPPAGQSQQAMYWNTGNSDGARPF